MLTFNLLYLSRVPMNAAIKCGVRRMFYPAQYVLDNQVMYIHEQHQVTNLLGPGTLFCLLRVLWILFSSLLCFITYFFLYCFFSFFLKLVHELWDIDRADFLLYKDDKGLSIFFTSVGLGLGKPHSVFSKTF